MSMSNTLQQYLNAHGASYEVISHPRAFTSMETAQAAHVAGERLAKSVLVEDAEHYVLVVVPASHRVDLALVCEHLGRQCGLATERELRGLFDDCELGAIPATGQAFGLPVLVDERLLELSDVYFEGGDHRRLVHLSGEQFRHLMADAEAGRFGERV